MKKVFRCLLSSIISVSIFINSCNIPILASQYNDYLSNKKTMSLEHFSENNLINSNFQITPKSEILTVTGGQINKDYLYENNTLTVLTDTPITISGSTNTDKIVVKSGIYANITLKNAEIHSSTNRPFDMSGAIVNLCLEGTNKLTSANFKTALFCPSGSDLTINGSGSLTASTDDRGGAAAIGGESVITFNSLINDDSQDWTTQNGTCGSITINSGTINAYAPHTTQLKTSPKAVAIGGFKGGPIIINGGIINAIGNENSVGIGSIGSDFNGITINGGEVNAESGGINMDDMGVSTALGPAIGVVSGYVDFKGNGIPITITGGKVKAKSGFGTAGIGGGRNGSGNVITIKGDAYVEASGGYGAAGIGGGYAQNGGGTGGIITIEENASVIARGGTNAAGIGGGAPRQQGVETNDGSSGIITIAGNANITAYGGVNAYGIGSGGSQGGNFPGPSIVDKIVIYDNPIIKASIGPGNLGNQSASKEERFNEFICTIPNISPEITPKNSLTVTKDDEEKIIYTVKGIISLNRSLTIPDNAVLNIPKDCIIYVPDGITFKYNENQVNGSGLVKYSEPPIPDGMYAITVINGSGSGYYKNGANVNIDIKAIIPDEKEFVKWEKTSGFATIKDINSPETSVLVYGKDTTITAILRDKDGISNIEINPEMPIVKKGKTQQFNAVVNGNGNISKEVLWSVSGANSNTKINTDGLLTVDINETAQTLIITAVSIQDKTKKATTIVTLTDNEPIKKHNITVINGSGSGEYDELETINISADISSEKTFVNWELTQGDGTIANANEKDTTFTVGTSDATITAILKDKIVDNINVTPDNFYFGIYPINYEPINAKDFIISNNNSLTIKNLNVSITGTNSNAFNLNKNNLSKDLSGNSTSSFQISPIHGLNAGNYSAVAEITGDNINTIYIDVSVKITEEAITYMTIDLNTVNLYNIKEKSILIISGYDENKISSLNTIIVNEGNSKFNLSDYNIKGKKIKIILWNSLNNMIPLCDSKEMYII